jgi:methylitaconate Delta-isomerase
MTAIPCTIVRGGTSKGIFMLDENLPTDPEQRDRLLLAMMGSPDPRQIDGLGGADPLTSKVAIVARSSRPGFDVEYESLEIGIGEAQVNHGLMCGNLLAGVGHFALAEGLVEAQSPETTIHIFCRSNEKKIVARVNVAPDNPLMPVSPVPNTPVSLRFNQPGGAISGELLPAGDAVSLLMLDQYRNIAVSIVDAGTLYAFVRADALGLVGDESVATLDADAYLRASIEIIRRKAAHYINRRGTSRVCIAPRQVKVAIIGSPPPGPDQADIVARVVNSANVHKAYAVSGGICLAAAAAIPGTLVNQIVRPTASPFQLRIAHPAGSMSLLTEWSADAAGVVIHATEIERSARVILRGTAYVETADSAASPDDCSRQAARLEALAL